jgi:hypothetical protein
MTETYTEPETVAEQENDYLQQQADDAKAAIGNAFSEAKTALAQGMDPSAWTRKYPLVAVGSALAAGFVAAMVAVKSNEPQPVSPQPPSAPPPAPKPGFWWSLIREAVEMVRPVLTAALIAAIKSPPSSQEPPNHPHTG